MTGTDTTVRRSVASGNLLSQRLFLYHYPNCSPHPCLPTITPKPSSNGLQTGHFLLFIWKKGTSPEKRDLKKAQLYRGKGWPADYIFVGIKWFSCLQLDLAWERMPSLPIRASARLHAPTQLLRLCLQAVYSCLSYRLLHGVGLCFASALLKEYWSQFVTRKKKSLIGKGI